MVISKVGKTAPCKIDSKVVKDAGHSILFEMEETGAVDVVLEEVLKETSNKDNAAFVL